MTSEESPLAGAALLVADDHVDSAELLEIVLARAGANVRTAATGAEVLELIKTFPADVFLLDITLPDMDGYELLAAIRAVPGFAKTPAVAVTGHAQERDEAKATVVGFSAHILKPFDRLALIKSVAELFQASAEARRAGVQQAAP